jgi:hypothetical protein
MKEQFNPLRGQRGEFRVSLNLTELGDRAWEILSLSQSLGFEKPQFKTCVRHSGATEVWAVILQQLHPYDADTRIVVDAWDDQLDTLRREIGRDNEFSLIVLYNFAEYLEPVEVIA